MMSAMKNILRKTLFILIFIVGAAVGTFAQSNDPKNPKQNPPVADPKDKIKPAPTPTPDKPKKPTAEIAGTIRTNTLI